jgi:hypothetical protein
VLALYIGVQSAHVLAVAFRPHHSQFGIVWLALTALAMFALSYAKTSTGNGAIAVAASSARESSTSVAASSRRSAPMR